MTQDSTSALKKVEKVRAKNMELVQKARPRGSSKIKNAVDHKFRRKYNLI